MAVYIFIFLLLAVLAIDYEFNKNTSIYLLGSVALLLALLAGFRHPSIERDYESYLYGFDLVYDGGEPLLLAIYEPGFVLIVHLVRSIFTYNYGVVIMLVYATVSVFLKSSGIRALAVNPYLVLLFYFSHYFMLHEMTQIRIGLASAIFFVAIPYFLRGNTRNYILLVLLAALFHYSAIFYLAVLFLKKDSFNRYFYASVILLSVALSFFKLPLIGYLANIDSNEFSAKIDNYTVAAEYAVEKINVLNTVTICNMLCCLYLIVAVAPGGFEEDKKLTIILKCNIISIFLLAFLAGVPSIAFRVSELFGILSMFSFAYLARYLPAGKYNVFIAIILAAVFFYFFALNSSLIKPYRIVNII